MGGKTGGSINRMTDGNLSNMIDGRNRKGDRRPDGQFLGTQFSGREGLPRFAPSESPYNTARRPRERRQ